MMCASSVTRAGSFSRRAAAALLGLTAFLIVAAPSRAHAQMDAGSLRVLVIDKSGGVVRGATVTLTNANTGVSQAAVSDDQGYVNFTPLPRGTYTLLSALDGFRSREVNDVSVDV